MFAELGTSVGVDADLTLVISDLIAHREGFSRLGWSRPSSEDPPRSSRASKMAAVLARNASSDPEDTGDRGSTLKLSFLLGVTIVFARLEDLGVRESTLSGTWVGVFVLGWTTAEKDCRVGGGDKVSLKLEGTE